MSAETSGMTDATPAEASPSVAVVHRAGEAPKGPRAPLDLSPLFRVLLWIATATVVIVGIVNLGGPLDRIENNDGGSIDMFPGEMLQGAAGIVLIGVGIGMLTVALVIEICLGWKRGASEPGAR